MSTLETIKDFDFGVGGSIMAPQRVAYGPKDVTRLEVDLIVWLMIEQEFRKLKKLSKNKSRTQHDGAKDDDNEDDGYGEDDSSNARLILTNENLSIAREYTEDVLREAGINMALEDLPKNTREEFLLNLCRSSDLFQGNAFRSVPDIFCALRSTSKFRRMFNVICSVGKGEFGEVYRVKHEEVPDKEFAVKKISCSFDSVKDDVTMAINESKILKRLKGHRNVIDLHDSWLEIESDTDSPNNFNNDDFDGPLKFYLQLDYCSHSLDAWKESNYRNKAVLERSKLIDIAFQLFDGLSYIHSKNILHLDINPRNILWKTPACAQLQIVDFGLATFGTVFHGRPGTVPYTAPENTMTPKSDVYSAAVTIIEVGRSIFTKSELHAVILAKDVSIGDFTLDELLLRCISENCGDRPTSSDFKQRMLMLMSF